MTFLNKPQAPAVFLRTFRDQRVGGFSKLLGALQPGSNTTAKMKIQPRNAGFLPSTWDNLRACVRSDLQHLRVPTAYCPQGAGQPHLHPLIKTERTHSRDQKDFAEGLLSRWKNRTAPSLQRYIYSGYCTHESRV